MKVELNVCKRSIHKYFGCWEIEMRFISYKLTVVKKLQKKIHKCIKNPILTNKRCIRLS